MKRSIVTTLRWDFEQSEGGLVTTLPPPEDISVPAVFRLILPERKVKPVRLASLSISSELWKTKWRQVGSIHITFDRTVFQDEEHCWFTKAAGMMSGIMSRLWREGHIESAHGWGTDFCSGSFHLAVDNKAFCEEAMTRGATILRAFCPDASGSSLIPKITQETYIWIPDQANMNLGQWKTYAEITAAKCGLVTG